MRTPLAVLGLAAALVAACEPNRSITDPDATIQARAERDDDDREDDRYDGPRAVYTITNSSAGNAVVVYARASNGTLSPGVAYPTGGAGTGAGLGSQGAVALSEDGRLLFAVNAGSNDISVFRVSPSGLTLATRFGSGGVQPTSLTVHGRLIYVLNAGGDGNITGFKLTHSAGIAAIAGSTQRLSASANGPSPSFVQRGWPAADRRRAGDESPRCLPGRSQRRCRAGHVVPVRWRNTVRIRGPLRQHTVRLRGCRAGLGILVPPHPE